MGIAKDSWETADPLCSIRWINDPFSVRSRLRQTLKLNESEKKKCFPLALIRTMKPFGVILLVAVTYNL